MVDQCKVTDAVVAQAGTTNLATGAVEFPEPVERYRGPASLSARASSRGHDTDLEQLQVDESIVKLPTSAPVLEPGQLVTWLQARDPDLVGATFEVVRAVGSTHALSRQAVVRRRTAYPFPVS
jgi:hypothetical protein